MTIFLIVTGILITSIILLSILFRTILSDDGRIQYIYRFLQENKLTEILVVIPPEKFDEQVKNFNDIKIMANTLIFNENHYELIWIEAATVMTFSTNVHQDILKIRKIFPTNVPESELLKNREVKE